MNFEPASLQSILNTVILIIGFVGVGYMTWKNNTEKAQKDATETWKDVSQAYETRLKQFESDVRELKDENKHLNALVNQLKGENKALKDIVVKPDSEFKETVTVILNEIRSISKYQSDLREDFIKHAQSDDKRFTDIGKVASDNNRLLIEMKNKKREDKNG